MSRKLLDVLGDALGLFGSFARFLHRLVPLVRSPVEPFQGLVDVGLPAQEHPDLQPGEHAQGVQGVLVGGVGHGHRQHPVLLVQGQDPELAQELGRQLLDHQGHGRKVPGGDELGLVLGREGRQHVLLGEVSQVQQDAADLVAPLPLQGQAVLKLRGGDQVPVHQDASDKFACRHGILLGTGLELADPDVAGQFFHGDPPLAVVVDRSRAGLEDQLGGVGPPGVGHAVVEVDDHGQGVGGLQLLQQGAVFGHGLAQVLLEAVHPLQGRPGRLCSSSWRL